jgi:hypothetical protein
MVFILGSTFHAKVSCWEKNQKTQDLSFVRFKSIFLCVKNFDKKLYFLSDVCDETEPKDYFDVGSDCDVVHRGPDEEVDQSMNW